MIRFKPHLKPTYFLFVIAMGMALVSPQAQVKASFYSKKPAPHVKTACSGKGCDVVVGIRGYALNDLNLL
jgi:hypothetical protein